MKRCPNCGNNTFRAISNVRCDLLFDESGDCIDSNPFDALQADFDLETTEDGFKCDVCSEHFGSWEHIPETKEAKTTQHI